MSDPDATMMTMSTSERPMPPLVADERTSLEGWLDFYRATLAQKCEELPEGQPVRRPRRPPR